MPYQFQLFINHHLHFSGDLERRRCLGRNKNGKRCARYVCIGLPYCFQHSLQHFHLKIKPSTLPNSGKGLFAVDPTKRENATIFLPGHSICEFTGQIMNLADLHRRYDEHNANGVRIAGHTAPYALELNNTTGIDAATSRGIASLANHKPLNQCNAIFEPKTIGPRGNRRHVIMLQCIRPIRNNQEIFVDYNEDYHFDPDETHRTIYKRN